MGEPHEVTPRTSSVVACRGFLLHCLFLHWQIQFPFGMARCPYCNDYVSKERNLRNHQSKSAKCLAMRAQARTNLLTRLDTTNSIDVHSSNSLGSQLLSHETSAVEMEVDIPGQHSEIGSEPALLEDLDSNAQQPTVEDVPDVAHEELWDEPFPSEKHAGASIGMSKTLFETYRDDQVLQGAEILGPFKSDAEWELAKWLIKNVGHTQADNFLKLPIVR